ncbi:putative beta-1,4-xylosyltransferase IRX9 [Carex littledalei]|uniref:Glycosyltransferases n=1 Tax=Carex littledalei TaxID=544730 RepID=A0A833R8Y8_9POAL|nr:putative beta-1,4-xylosyltransferase IRX9 [Carex littledalei]
MGSVERSKKKIQLWKKALVHFSLCFVMGFFTGFAPTTTHPTSHFYHPITNFIKPNRIQALEKTATPNRTLPSPLLTQSVPEIKTQSIPDPDPETINDDLANSNPPGLLIIVTTTRPKDRFKEAALTRLAHTLRLVRSPIVWIVVEAHREAASTADMLRRTGIMYRHLTFKENFTNPIAERHHQRNVALSHVEHHRLTGILHFADLDTVYDLQFFEEIRRIDVFGTWPVARLSASRRRVTIEGPLCRDSKVVGWFTKDTSVGTTKTVSYAGGVDANSNTAIGGGAGSRTGQRPHPIDASGFAFNSSILWDPERWGRPTSLPDTSQDSIKFVQEVVLEDGTKLKGVPSDCSLIMLWHLHTPRPTPQQFSQNQRRR